jgi:hypothetical protein
LAAVYAATLWADRASLCAFSTSGGRNLSTRPGRWPGWPGPQQVIAHVTLVDGGGHDAPGPDDTAAQVCLDRQAEPVEPFAVRGVAAEPCVQATGAGPGIGAADPEVC